MTYMKRYYTHLDLYRGIASLFVFIYHCRILFFRDWSERSSHSVFEDVFYFLTSFGYEAVIVFFVLSGVVVSNSVLNLSREKSFSWNVYLAERLSRLWIVLGPAIILGLLLDWGGMILSGPGGIYEKNNLAHVIDGRLSVSMGLATLFGNFFFLQGILVETFGSNGALWSLSYEFWYYMVFPLFYFALFPNKSVKTRIVLVVGGCLILCFLGGHIASRFIIWVLGFVALLAYRHFPLKNSRIIRLSYASSLVLLGALLVAIRSKRYDILCTLNREFVLGVVVAVIFYFALHCHKCSNGWIWTLVKSLGNISYSLYLLHVPFLVFVVSLFIKSDQDRWVFGLRSGIYIVGVGLLCFVYVIVVYWVTGRRTREFQRWFVSKAQRVSDFFSWSRP
jgi:peptidoglycan/LPS O-acetylase OafA/YrhL